MTITVTSPMPAMSPTIPPIERTVALGRGGRRHDRQLATAITLLSVRPVVSIPISPTPTANQRDDDGCVSASLIWRASSPVMPTLSMSSEPTYDRTKPAMPTTNTSSGTKNRNRRSATALPTTLPADSRSRR